MKQNKHNIKVATALVKAMILERKRLELRRWLSAAEQRHLLTLDEIADLLEPGTDSKTLEN